MDTNAAAYTLGYGLGQVLANGFLFLVVGVVIALVVFLVVRWFWLWYWKVNTQVALLQEIAQSLARLEGRSVGATPPAGTNGAGLGAQGARSVPPVRA